MNTIIHEIMGKVITDYEKVMGKLIDDIVKGKGEISEVNKKLEEMLDEIGVMLVKHVLETIDDIVRDSEARKEKGYNIEKRNVEKTLITVFGDVNYKRTYYKNKRNGEYAYLSDEILGLEPNDRMDMLFETRLIENAIDLSYRKSGKSVSSNTEVADQTVMNTIRKLGKVENNIVEIKEKKKEIDILFIEADEDHVPMQDGTNRQIKLVYVHEGRRLVSKDRYELKNPRFFAGYYTDSEELWLEVADYLDKAYDMEKVEKVYLSGDGANWIREGLNWINKSEYVLDYFHLSKYVRIATAHMEPCFHRILWDYIDGLNKEAVKDLLNLIIEQTESKTKREAVKDSKRYILRNWEGIVRRYDDDYIGCSAEGHVSHILSARLSSRPLGWSIEGADQMARLRVYKTNGGDIYRLMKNKKSESKKEARIIELDKRVVKGKLKASFHGNLDNIPAINSGKRTWEKQIFKSVRGI